MSVSFTQIQTTLKTSRGSVTGTGIKTFIGGFLFLLCLVIGFPVIGEEAKGRKDVALDGSWNFMQYWDAQGTAKSISGSVTVKACADNMFIMTFQWVADGKNGSSDWSAVRDPDGLLVATGIQSPKAGILLGRGSAGECLSGVIFFPSVKSSGASGIQLCRLGSDFDQALVSGWASANGVATVMNPGYTFDSTLASRFAAVRQAWVAQSNPANSEGGIPLKIAKAFTSTVDEAQQTTPGVKGDDQSIIKALRNHPKFIGYAPERARSALSLCQQTSAGQKDGPQIRCFIDRGYITIGAHLGFSAYPVNLTAEGAKIIRVSEVDCVASGMRFEPILVDLAFVIEGRQVKDDSMKILFSVQLKVADGLGPCVEPGSLDVRHYKAELEKYDTGWVVSSIDDVNR